MKPSSAVENALNVSLPKKYCNLIDDENADKLYDRFTTYIDTDVVSIIESNRGYILERDSIDDLDDGTFWGSLKRLFIHGSRKNLLKQRQSMFTEWIEPRHFIIGGDYGEGMYFIKLDDPECHVYRFDLETGKTRKKPYGLSKYINYLDELSQKNT
ncbi:hypothetical protein GCM10008090_24630 [Arenicella chitinivorans]|uniref:SMI1/KNR4 family protein n=1 Tax=Arenicella chitinivorans TaxID=1329800 RepID=A0A918VMW3_9GAMM|nr:hypothetical protein [Arenicella chitinivorans]GHA13923.1 hypothetical protein GCM10008090_24630 [Arenicella chitinivorans]